MFDKKKKSWREAASTIVDLQMNYPIWTWRVDGVDIAPLLLRRIWDHLYQDSAGVKSEKYACTKKFVYRARTLWISILSVARTKTVVNSNAIAFVSSSSARRLSGGKWVDVITAPYRDWVIENSMEILEFESVPFGNYRSPLDNKPIITQLWIFLAKLHYKCSLLKRKENIQKITGLPGFSNLISEINETLPIETENLLKEITLEIAMIKRASDQFQKYFRRHNVKHCFVVCYYGVSGYAAVLASKNLKIPATDIQHGLQGDTHPSYGLYRPKEGESANTLPDNFLLWSESEQKTIENWGRQIGVKTIIAGHSWLNHLRGKGLVKNTKNNTHPKIMLTLQTGVELPKFFWDYLSKSSSTHTIRLHPGMLSEHKTWENKFQTYKNVQVSPSHEHILEALAGYAIHLTCFSSVAHEAAWLGIPTIFLGTEPSSTLFQEDLKLGFFKVANSSDELLEMTIKPSWCSNTQKPVVREMKSIFHSLDIR